MYYVCSSAFRWQLSMGGMLWYTAPTRQFWEKRLPSPGDAGEAKQ